MIILNVLIRLDAGNLICCEPVKLLMKQTFEWLFSCQNVKPSQTLAKRAQTLAQSLHDKQENYSIENM